eukprot:5320494-Pleurochrysis_carterae.AAC.4
MHMSQARSNCSVRLACHDSARAKVTSWARRSPLAHIMSTPPQLSPGRLQELQVCANESTQPAASLQAQKPGV